jgi:hypothetical protein
MNAPYPKKDQYTSCVTIVMYCVYLLVAFYWGLRLLPTVLYNLWYSNDLPGPYIALSVLNIMVLALITVLAIKAFGGKVGLGLFMLFSIVAAVGTTWLNSTVPMVTF